MTTSDPAGAAGRAQGGFSPSVSGLRGRLVAASPGAAPFAIELELENTGAQPLRVTLGDPFALTATLEDASGHAIAPTGARLEVLSSSETVELAPGARQRHAITERHDDVAASLDLTTVFWKLAAGRYRLSATWSSHVAGSWSGALALVPLELEQR
jgi:hypothetical protein